MPYLCVLAMALSLAAGEPRRLTDDGSFKTDPTFLRPDELVYSLQQTPTLFRLMRLKLGGIPEPLHADATTSEFEPTFASDGSYAFIQSRSNLNVKLVIKDPKNGREAVFDPGGGFASLRRPTFRPDGSQVAFSIPAPNGQTIDEVDRLARGRRTLTQGGINTHPAYSPDGRRIAFSSSREGDFEIFVMDADGGNVTRMTRSPGMDLRPTWSPDGKRIAFTSNRDGNYEIYVMDADGGNVTRITNHPERDDYPVWHPDGKRLISVSERGGKFDLYEFSIR